MTSYLATKHASAADEVISLLSSVTEGYGSEEAGDVGSPVGFISLVVLDDTCDLDFNDLTNYPLGDEVGEVARTYGVTADDVRGAHIVTVEDSGFVNVETFETETEAREEFACRAGRLEAWSESDEGDGVYVCPATGHGYHTL